LSDNDLREAHDEAKLMMKSKIKKEMDAKNEWMDSLMSDVDEEFDSIKKINEANKNANELKGFFRRFKCSIL